MPNTKSPGKNIAVLIQTFVLKWIKTFQDEEYILQFK